MRRPVKPFHCTPACLCRCAVLLSVISPCRDWEEGGGTRRGGGGGGGQWTRWIEMEAVFLFFSQRLTLFLHPKHSYGGLSSRASRMKLKPSAQWGGCICCGVRGNGNNNRIDNRSKWIMLNCCWEKPVGQIWNRRCFAANWGLYFKEMFMGKTGAVNMQAIMLFLIRPLDEWLLCCVRGSREMCWTASHLLDVRWFSCSFSSLSNWN